MRLMQLVEFRRILPKALRHAFRGDWNKLLAWEHYRRERRFYRQFIQPNDLVFDVGANIGGKVAAFLSLGARVVAVEPNPFCVGLVRERCRVALSSGALHLEERAVASSVGQVKLTIFESNHELSSGSLEFVEYARTIDHGITHEVIAQATTLDALINKYGLPDFLKIDVEGMDAEALAGLNRRPRLLSFEYNTSEHLWENSQHCLNQAVRLGFTKANLTAMAEPRLLFREWIGIEDARIQLHTWREGGDRWGDVIVT
jgi:FkbM family methyltransferase